MYFSLPKKAYKQVQIGVAKPICTYMHASTKSANRSNRYKQVPEEVQIGLAKAICTSNFGCANRSRAEAIQLPAKAICTPKWLGTNRSYGCRHTHMSWPNGDKWVKQVSPHPYVPFARVQIGTNRFRKRAIQLPKKDVKWAYRSVEITYMSPAWRTNRSNSFRENDKQVPRKPYDTVQMGPAEAIWPCESYMHRTNSFCEGHMALAEAICPYDKMSNRLGKQVGGGNLFVLALLSKIILIPGFDLSQNQFDLSQNQFDFEENQLDSEENQVDFEQNQFDSTQINLSRPPPV